MAENRKSPTRHFCRAVLILSLLPSLVPFTASVTELPSPSETVRGSACQGRRIYVHKLPPKFNGDLRYSEQLAARVNDEWFAPYMLSHLQRASTANGFGSSIQGELNFGKPVKGLERVWYETDQNSLEVIFEARMKSYDCLVVDYRLADLVYVPYFGGLDSLHHMHHDTRRRDSLALQLLQLLKFHPAWQQRNGSDHFWVLGRNIWDFFRQGDNKWGSQLLALDGVRHNMWTVVVETCPGEPRVISAPKPTAFHPQSRLQVQTWQAFVGAQERKQLFSYVGGARSPDTDAGAMRQKISWQCQRSEACSTMTCAFDSNHTKCDDVSSFFQLYLSSQFCLHPTGDACSRRSVLDGMLAGCIPVVFRPCSLEDQFQWHFQSNPAKDGPFFIYIPAESLKGPAAPGDSANETQDASEDLVLIEDELRKLSVEEIAAMRRRVVSLIPAFTYGGEPKDDGTFETPDFRDAVDLIIDGLVENAANEASDQSS